MICCARGVAWVKLMKAYNMLQYPRQANTALDALYQSKSTAEVENERDALIAKLAELRETANTYSGRAQRCTHFSSNSISHLLKSEMHSVHSVQVMKTSDKLHVILLMGTKTGTKTGTVFHH